MTARLRLFLAILVLALAPLLVPAGAMSAVPQQVTASAGGLGCDHPCDGMNPAHKAQTVCPCAAQLVLPPLAVAATAAPVLVALGRSGIPADISRASTRWPPPLRPPRA